MLGQRDGAVLARVTPEGLRCTPEPAGINQKKKKKIFSLEPLFIYIYGLQHCLPQDYKCIPAAPCEAARACLNLSEYFRYKIIFPLA